MSNIKKGDRVIAIQNDESTCMNCLREGDVKTIEIGSLGYGSSFDGWSTKIKLCNKCYEKTNKNWWELKIIRDEYCEEYEHEDEIFDYIKSMPLAGQELFWNRYTYGWDAHNMEPQDWIDYELDILPHEKCKEYRMYSPQEEQAYKDRFPTCNHVFKKVYSDGSSGCWCHKNAHGNSDGECGLNISDECYLCTDYMPKKDTMKIINVSEEMLERERQRLSEMISYATKNLELLNSNPQKFYEQNEK